MTTINSGKFFQTVDGRDQSSTFFDGQGTLHDGAEVPATPRCAFYWQPEFSANE